jgi:hypothetical protein
MIVSNSSSVVELVSCQMFEEVLFEGVLQNKARQTGPLCVNTFGTILNHTQETS